MDRCNEQGADLAFPNFDFPPALSKLLLALVTLDGQLGVLKNVRGGSWRVENGCTFNFGF